MVLSKHNTTGVKENYRGHSLKLVLNVWLQFRAKMLEEALQAVRHFQVHTGTFLATWDSQSMQ